MSSRPYYTQNYFNYKKGADNYLNNNNLYQQNKHNDHSYQQNDIMNINNEFKDQNRITSITPKGNNIRKKQNLQNNFNIQNYKNTKNSNQNNHSDYNKLNFNYGNNSSNPNENYNNNYNNKNFNLNQRNINSQDYNGYQYSEQKKHNELILKILIYIYYYEKDLSQKNIFINSIEKYYLINQNWFNQFKIFYSYNKLKIQLDSIKNHDYDFIDMYIVDIINKIIQTTKTNYQLLPQNLKTNIFSNQKGIIIPQKIMNLIYELDQDSINFEKSYRFIFKYNDNIYYINNKTIFFGTFQKSALFEPKYIFEYNSIVIESNEEKKIFYSDINEYIKEKNCNLQKYRQILRNGDANIGALIIPSLKRQQSGGNNNQSKNPQKQPFNMMNLDIKNINNNIDNQNKESNNYNKGGVQIAKKIKVNDIINQNNINTNKLKQELLNPNNTDNNKNKDNKMISNLTTPNNNIDEGKELLKAFIYIYYYEKSLAEKNIFLNNKENYYLINTDWLYNFKKLYLYEKIENILKTKEGIYDYNIIGYIIDSIINNELKEIQLQKIQFNENKNALSNILPGLNRNKDIVYISRGIIFPSKILNIIKNVYKEFKSLQIKRLIFKEDYIYYLKLYQIKKI